MAKKTPIISIKHGQLQGVYQDKGNIAVFKGVPFAQPPVGDLRWRPPQPLEPWAGVRDASQFGPMAIQYMAGLEQFISNLIDGQGWGRVRTAAIKRLFSLFPQPVQSEDCLYLNVRTPSLDSQAKLPVMVWIHGGDHQDGGGSDVFYDSNALAHQEVVVVTINYRLGVMGYFAHPELTLESAENVSGNYGTLDQIAALQWVQDNIAAFGGDPDNVTIFGESAGGESVIHMMTSPLACGLFHKAIAQSPANAGQMVHHSTSFMDYDSAETHSEKFANALGITGNNQLARLRELSAEQIYALARIEPVLGTHYPCIDGHVLPKSPFEAFADGDQADVPFLIGSNADEGTLIYPLLETLLPEYRFREQPAGKLPDYMTEAFGDDVDKLCGIYLGLAEVNAQAACDLSGDYMFGSRAYFYAQQASHAGQPTFLYLFARTPNSPNQTAGAYHAAELSFVHGSDVPIFPMSKADKQLSAKMIQYWTRFAKVGSPNGIGRLDWPWFSAENPEWLRLNHNISAEAVTRRAQYDIFSKHMANLIDQMKALRVTA